MRKGLERVDFRVSYFEFYLDPERGSIRGFVRKL